MRSNQGAHVNRPANVHREGSANRASSINGTLRDNRRPIRRGNVGRGHAPAARSSGAGAAVAEDAAVEAVAVDGGPTSGSSTTSRLSVISTTGSASTASATTAATSLVGVIAQEVQKVMPDAVVRGGDGYLRVFYEKLGLHLQTYNQWIASGGQMPASPLIEHDHFGSTARTC